MTKLAARIAGIAAVVLALSGMGAAAANAQPSVGGTVAGVIEGTCDTGLASAICVAP